MKIFKLITLLVFFASTYALAQAHPDRKYNIWRLPHFDLIYDAEHQQLAEIYASRLEGSVSYLSKYFTQFPEKSVIVLSDQTDLTNGFATPIPYNTMGVYPVLPPINESIGSYGDWAYELLIHESTHLSSMHYRRDAMKGLYYIFGTVISPNLLMPRWWLEGVAVDMETRLSAHGRLRSPQQDASLRALVNESQWSSLELADINEQQIPSWPYGGRPYLFGSLFWSDLIAEKGPEIVDQLHQAQGGRVPYFINSPAEEILGADYSDKFLRFKQNMQALIEKQIQQLKKTPTSELIDLDLSGIENFSPAISPNGLRMVFIRKDETSRRSLQVLERPSGQEPFSKSHLRKSFGDSEVEEASNRPAPIPGGDGPPGGTILRASWSPDSNKIVYDMVDRLNRFEEFSDLHEFNLTTGKSTQLSHGLRGREPAFSLDGKKIVYVQLEGGRTSLALFDIESKTHEILWQAPWQARISLPTYTTANEIYFSLRQEGYEQLWKIKLGDKNPQSLNYKKAYAPQWINNELYFISESSGVANITTAQQNKTHVLTAVHSYAWDKEQREFILTAMSSTGYKIFRTKSLSLTQLPTLQPLLADRYPAQTLQTQDIQPTAVEEYSAGEYLWPRYWLPFIWSDQNGVLISASTSSADPLMRHQYSLYAAYSTYTQAGTYSFTYVNNSTWTEWVLNAYESNSYLITNTSTSKSQAVSLIASRELLFMSPDWVGSLGMSYASRAQLGGESKQMGPSIGLSYSKFSQAGAQISPESGQAGSFVYTSYLSGENRQDYQWLTASYLKYFSKFLPQRHAVMMKLQGFYMDKNVSTSNLIATTSYNSAPNTSIPNYLVRGYSVGQFLARAMGVMNLEYRFPIWQMWKGWGTTPLYLKRLHGAVILDGVTADGLAFDNASNRQAYVRIRGEKNYLGTGLELKLDATIGYQFSMSFLFGVYAPLDTSLSPSSPSFALAFQL